MSDTLTIGGLAGRAQSAVETIRYYERMGLLPRPQRSESNYRLYEEQHLERLVFIRHCRLLDLSLDEIRALLELRDTPEKSCHDVNAVLDEHLRQVNGRIAELQHLRALLRGLRARCRTGRAVKDCRILAELSRHAQAVTIPNTQVGRVNRAPKRTKRTARNRAAV